jgi:hypothetical protein
MSVGGAAGRGDSDIVVLSFVVIAGVIALSVLFASPGPGYASGQRGFGASRITASQARMVPAQTLITPSPVPAQVTRDFGDFGILPMPSSPLLAASDLAGVGRGASGGGRAGEGNYGSLDEAFPDPLRGK